MTSDGIKLRMIDASQSYDGRRWQFRDLSFDLQAGEIIAILGPNGRGKSTLLRVIAGLLKPTAGTLALNARTGFVPQEFAGSFPYTVLDVVLMGRARHVGLFRTPEKLDIERAMDALSATGMADYVTRDINGLSGGERQLVLIARALAGENEVLLLDEPASALDLNNQDRVLTLIGEVADRNNLAVAFTTHQPNHAVTVADTVLLMLPEASTILGKTDAVLNEANLEALYGVPVRSVRIDDGAQGQTTFAPVFRNRQRKDAAP